ncbi:MAG: signal peptidase II [Acidimicrobiales bacterium]
MEATGVAPDERSGRVAPFLGAAAVVVALDQLTKHWALAALADGPVDLVGSLRLNLVFNDGAAFSLGAGNTTVISVLGLVVVAMIVRLGLTAESRASALGFGVVLGGALGNLTDRAFRRGDGVLGGYVVDFVDLQWWPVFNLADAALWVGIGLLLIAYRRESAGTST